MENRKKTVYELLSYACEHFGDVNAICRNDLNITYKDLFEIVKLRAIMYQREGCIGKYIDIKPELSIKFLIEFLSLSMAGAVVVLHEPGLRLQEFDVPVFKYVDPEKSIEEECLNFPGNNENDEEYQNISENEICTLIFTSGTSGRQKGVLLSQKNIITDAMLGYKTIGIEALKPGDRTIPVLPVFHMFGITASMLSPIYAGLSLCFIEDIKYLSRKINIIRPKILFLVPMILKALLAKAQQMLERGVIQEQYIKEKVFGGADIVVSGGAPLADYIAEGFEKYGIKVLNGYGITECSPIVTVSNHIDYKTGAVGKINNLYNTKVVIHNGCILVGGDIVMEGYYTEEENPFIFIDEERFFNTKDYGLTDDDGNLYIRGRDSNLIIMDDGNNISPEEIENRFEKYAAIEGVIVYPGKVNGNNILCITVKPTNEIIGEYSLDEIKSMVNIIIKEVNAALPSFKMIKKAVIRTEPFIKTGLNKIKRIEENTNGQCD
ncbi:MAG: AMP-binding protein [Lachnospiraceae bacterium]|nr:AMP-binding protein [Lachnospiraceae bacterium]